MLTILSVIGTRPEAIKMAPVVRALATEKRVRSLVYSSGQHRELLKPIFDLFHIQADQELGVMQPNQSLAGLTARLLEALDRVLEQTRPDWVLAQGDTTTVLAAALACYYRKIRLGHVEAGLRTGDLWQPFPEEINRRIADEAATLLFAPTAGARQALLEAGRSDEQIIVTGNTVIDALHYVLQQPFDLAKSPLARLPLDKRLVLVTAHRRESFGAPLSEICHALRDLAAELGPGGVEFIYPVHPNPNVREPVYASLGNTPHVSLVEPLDYAALAQLMKRCCLILTDSGGIQEEAPELGVPVLVLRETTERPEGVAAGVVKLVGTSRAAIVQETRRLLTDETARRAMTQVQHPYGDGHAAQRIVAALVNNGSPGRLGRHV